jgi:hypothetical protein
MDLRRLTILLLAFAATACSSMLPRGAADTPEGFDDFEQAQAAAVQIEPGRTRTAELKTLGFDPAAPNVVLIPYPDILARLAPYSGVPVEQLDAGIRECIEARTLCHAYLFRFERQARHREGSFWLDFLNVRRTTHVTGWWFEALVVVSDERVLFRNYAGQAGTDRIEKQVNPLGPFQPAGESAGSLISR